MLLIINLFVYKVFKSDVFKMLKKPKDSSFTVLSYITKKGSKFSHLRSYKCWRYLLEEMDKSTNNIVGDLLINLIELTNPAALLADS